MLLNKINNDLPCLFAMICTMTPTENSQILCIETAYKFALTP